MGKCRLPLSVGGEFSTAREQILDGTRNDSRRHENCFPTAREFRLVGRGGCGGGEGRRGRCPLPGAAWGREVEVATQARGLQNLPSRAVGAWIFQFGWLFWVFQRVELIQTRSVCRSPESPVIPPGEIFSISSNFGNASAEAHNDRKPAIIPRVSEVNYRRNGNKYSSSGKCWGLSPKIGQVKVEDKGPKPKSSRERRARKKGK